MGRAVNPDVLEAFDAVIARLTPEGAWCQHAYARTVMDLPVVATDPRARSWCLGGAIFAEAGPPLRWAVYDAIEAVQPNCTHWNDTPGQTQAKVLALLRRARNHYALAEAERA